MSEVCIVSAQNADIPTRKEPFRVTEYMMSGLYRYPDKEPFALPHWWNGLSLSTYWYPKLLNVQVDYQGWEQQSFGVALSKDFSKSSAVRLSYAYERKRNEWMLDYQWNLSNFYGGYDSYRKWEWLATIGLTGGASECLEAFGKKNFFGGQMGVQLRHTLSPYVSFYIEPQYKVVSSRYDGHWSYGDVVDDGLSLQVGLITRLTGPFRQDVYGHGAHNVLSWLHGVGSRLFLPEGLLVNIHEGMQRWYSQLLGGAQLNIGDATDWTIHPCSFEMNIGKRINRIYAIQGGVYQQSLKLLPQSGTQEAFGLRVEAVADVLNAIYPDAEKMGWSWTISAGGEAGRVETWNEEEHVYHDYGVTMASQIRRHINGPLWAILQGRLQTIPVGNHKMQVHALAGVQYNMNDRKGNKVSIPNWWNGFSLSVADGWWNARNNVLNLGIGYDFSAVHGVKIDYSYARTDLMKTVSHNAYWVAWGFDYVANLSNAVLGNEYNRPFSLKALYGYNMAIHDEEKNNKLIHTSSYIGMEAGLQLEYKLAKHISIYAQEKSLFLPFDLYLNRNSQRAWNMIGVAGIICHL